MVASEMRYIPARNKEVAQLRAFGSIKFLTCRFAYLQVYVSAGVQRQ